MLTCFLFKTQTMLMSATSRKGQPDADFHTVQNPDQALVSNNRKGLPDADLHPVQNTEHALVSNKQERLSRC